MHNAHPGVFWWSFTNLNFYATFSQIQWESFSTTTSWFLWPRRRMSPSACHKQSLLEQARARILVSAVEICISSEALVAEELYNIYSDTLFTMIVNVWNEIFQFWQNLFTGLIIGFIIHMRRHIHYYLVQKYFKSRLFSFNPASIQGSRKPPAPPGLAGLTVSAIWPIRPWLFFLPVLPCTG